MTTPDDLREAIRRQDPDLVEDVLSSLELSAGVLPELILLLTASWHYRHEDVAGALQRLKDPAAVAALYEAAHMKHEYLSYNDSHALARKCTWALADIGTPEAKARLEALAGEPDTTVAGYAQRRLDRWDEEITRKGSSK